jgi:hypothetical protein
MESDDVLAELVEECHQVYFLELGEVVRLVRYRLKVREAAEVRRVSLLLIRRLISKHSFLPCDLSADRFGFVPWDLPLKVTLDRIAREWKELFPEVDPPPRYIVYLKPPASSY